MRRQVEKRFAQVLTQSIQESGLVGELMREVEIKLFSQDHGWRDLIENLNQCGPEHDAYKRLALVKYMQYLTARQEVVKTLYANRQLHRVLQSFEQLATIKLHVAKHFSDCVPFDHRLEHHLT